MNKLLLSLLFLAATSSVFAAKKKPVKTPAAQGTTAKSLALGSGIPMEGHMVMTTEGHPTSLAMAKQERGLIVLFSCNTCPYVVKAQGTTKMAMDIAKELRFGMVVVNSNEAQRENEDSRIRMTEYAEIHKYSAPYLIDEQAMLANAFGATRTPEVFLFDGNGKLVYKGALEDNPADPGHSQHRYLVEAMEALSQNKPIAVKESKSIGCSIKRLNQ